ncbi:exopolyphosphatase/guanosine-5'-triphosphate,3'-diphosphate pyrophosphatase [Neomicrococcus aestuarii]|uniref:Exopolyphosphatase/guanosine-5'-triphosphate, 3'-diphosphate pyrophosphatase n=1 Tax=Neomicrococcus aestuarii TaxID=556325 RepID=A0A7W8WZF9_9MICC|nr:Ppx/GppA phosphatase family protein [Neomicrococcus aestuarii]MBB5513336.1 exopolyphosphatase/guanosine-5'-triphosphate,3'-diphosphate pyrophosphatase [Neomicrococcus aestuarii]
MRLGVLDIGSNTVHLLLVDAHPGARPVAFASHKRPLSLIQYQDESGAITEEGQRELIDFVSEAADFARRHHAEDFLAFCTSAIRESANGPSVLDRVMTETGVTLMELSGEQEAAVTYFAVRRWFGWSAKNIMNLDIGGGSMELTIGWDALPAAAYSVPLGAGRLTRDFLPDDPPSPRDVKDLRKYIKSTLKEPVAVLKEYEKPKLVAATSKTFRSLARICGAAPSAEGPYVKRLLRLEDLKLWTRRLEAMTIEDRALLPGVSEVRAPQVLAGALSAEIAMEMLGLEQVRICPWALREGILLQRFDHLMAESGQSLNVPGHLGSNLPLGKEPHVPGTPHSVASAAQQH